MSELFKVVPAQTLETEAGAGSIDAAIKKSKETGKGVVVEVPAGELNLRVSGDLVGVETEVKNGE